MNANRCINENFGTPLRISELQQTVNEKCPFDELEDNSVENPAAAVTTDKNANDRKCDQDLTSFANITLRGIETKTSEVIGKFNEFKAEQNGEFANIVARALEAQALAQAKALKDQQTYFNEVLENKTAEIVEVKVQSLLKMSEIERLNEELQKKNQESIEKNAKIKKLEEKVELMLTATSEIYK